MTTTPDSPMTTGRRTIDFAAIRERLGASQGPAFWRSLEELADTPEFRAMVEREFPEQASEWVDPITRRRFLQLMGASLALGGLGSGAAGCTRQPPEAIVPYVRAPEEIVPGKPLYFATAVTLSGVATGVLVESHMGRPTKVEGNPDHPASRGAVDALSLAAPLGLYDPDRSQTATWRGEIRPFSAFIGAARVAVLAIRSKRGAGFRILTETVTSPTLAAQIKALLADLPEARWHRYEPGARDQARAGAKLAFGEVVETRYALEKADAIVALDADVLACGGGALQYARELAARRRAGIAGERPMPRLYTIESGPSVTGSVADHRLAVRASEVEGLARALARAAGALPEGVAVPDPGRHAKWIATAGADLAAHRGACVVIAGDDQPAAVHALAHAMNHALGNVGTTVFYTDPIEPDPVDQLASLRELVADMDAGRVETLLILGGNPVYTAPADLDFAARLEKVKLRIHLSLYQDETSVRCHWHIPAAHELEMWSDARAFDGTVTILQPLIAPLYGGRSAHEVVAAFTERPERTGYEIVREHWRGVRREATDAEFESWWRRAVHDGVVPGTALAPRAPALRPLAEALGPAPPAPAADALEIVFRLDPTVHDGRFANNGWLQELPKPLTKLTWDNAALVAPALAERLDLENGDVVTLALDGRTVRAPIWVVPGQPDGSVTVHLGYGRTRAGRVGNGAGFDAGRLRTTRAPGFALGLTIEATGDAYPLACTQGHHTMVGRDLVRSATLDHFRAHPDFAARAAHGPAPAPGQKLSLYPEWKYESYAWGMAIDLSTCTGCNACVVACQAENNVPIVGKEQVLAGREMHWLRVDRYFEGPPDAPTVHHMPVPCMHCENAPCEVVCPVAATAHSAEGLNDMVYNRCVGTRYCSNNCPYKVRRFNFLAYTRPVEQTPVLQLLMNPDVTVRTRGVMEKCTYCVQRINAARIDAKKEERRIRDGEVVPACAAACPAEAIVFGDVNDRNARVTKAKADPRSYGLLTDLNTRPRTTYLAAVRNPNPALGTGEAMPEPTPPGGGEKGSHG